jgi:DNA-binding MarR family transcriptional regulator
MKRKNEVLTSVTGIIAKECIAGQIRQINRAINRIYNKAFRPFGITVNQMNILVAICFMEPVSQKDLCRSIYIEKSTLSRDVGKMLENGWLRSRQGDDERITLLSVKPAGKKLILKAYSAWQQAQEESLTLIGLNIAKSFHVVSKSILRKNI